MLEFQLLHVSVGIAGLVLFVLLVWPVIEHADYLLKVALNRKKYEGVKPPKTAWGIPFGIFWFIRISNSIVEERMPQTLAQEIRGQNTLTGRSQVLGRFIFWTIEPENIKTVLATKFKDFSLGLRHAQFFPLLGNGIFTLDGAGWAHSRSMLRPQFSREQISHVSTIETHVKKVIELLRGSKTDYIDIQSIFFKLTLDTATEFLFGESVSILSGGNPKIPDAIKFGEAFNRSQTTLAKRSSAQNFYYLLGGSQFQKDCKLCQSFTSSYVQMALDRNRNEKESSTEKSELSYVFLDELTKKNQDPVELRDQALNILLAGRDTTASLLSFVFFELLRHPDIYQKLREDILEAFGTGTEAITFESLKRCVFLRYVINETLRLYPVVPTNFRVAVTDTVLPRGGGPDESSPVFVPKGSTIIYSVYGMHRHPKIWGPDADDFNPDRWRSPRAISHAWDFLPFNGGPRICLGQQFALTEASYTITRILQTFSKLEAKPGSSHDDQPLQAALTMCVGGGQGVPLKAIE